MKWLILPIVILILIFSILIYNFIPRCGDGKITEGEDCGTCPIDVKCASFETCQNNKCINFCGNDMCDQNENKCTCAKDCGKCEGDAPGICQEYICLNTECEVRDKLNCCGNNIPEKDENCQNCPNDVKCEPNNICKNGVCTKKYFKEIGDNNIIVVCEDNCPITTNLLTKSYEGSRKAYEKLILLTGIDFEEELKPIHVHLMSDNLCGSAEDMMKEYGFITGFASYKMGEGAICLFSYEKDNLAVPFNELNANRIQANLLTIHELVHLLFWKTSTSYTLQENFAKAISFRISGFWDGNGIQDKNFLFVGSACDDKYKEFSKLSYLLCQQQGFDFDQYPLLFKQIKKEINNGKDPTDI